MTFYYDVKTEKAASKLAGLCFFEENDEPMEISGENTSEVYYDTQGGYDYEGCAWDAESAAETIKKKVKNSRIAFCSEIDEGTGMVTVVWCDFDEKEIHTEDLDCSPSADIGTDEWIEEVKEMVEEINNMFE